MALEFTVRERIEGYRETVLYIFDQLVAQRGDITPSQLFAIASDVVFEGMKTSEVLLEDGHFQGVPSLQDMTYSQFLRVGINAEIVGSTPRLKAIFEKHLNEGAPILKALTKTLLERDKGESSGLFGDVYGA